MGMNVGGGKGKKSPIGEINVTPLVDVMLVLLIIFIIATPAMKENVDIDLPKGKGQQVEDGGEDPANVIEVDKNKIVHVNGRTLGLNDVPTEFPRLLKGKEKQILTVKAHNTLLYQDVITVVTALKEAGIETIHVQVDPRQDDAKK